MAKNTMYDDVDLDEDPVRKARLYRLEPKLRAIHAWMELPKGEQDEDKDLFDPGVPGPKLTKAQVTEFMRDLREEGNAMFKERHYKQSCEFYTQSLLAAKILQVHHNQTDDSEFISSLFSNRATCHFKMKAYPKAIEDSDYAIYLNFQNIKAYYRKATAHKAKEEYLYALSTAEKGVVEAERLGKQYEVNELKDMIRELRTHVTASTRVYDYHPGQKSSNGAKSKGQEPFELNTQEISVANASKSRKKNEIDESWLQGTAAADPSKHQSLPSKKKKKKEEKYKDISDKSKSSKVSRGQAYEGRYDAIDSDDSVQSEASQGEADDFGGNSTESSDQEEGATANTDWSAQVPDDDDLNLELDYMGLDDPYSHRQHAIGSNWQKVGTASAKPVNNAVSTSSKKLTDFPIFDPPELPSYPFDHIYFFTLVCERCYTKVGEGPSGFRAQPNLPHNCAHNVLLVKYKNRHDNIWIKIRPRQNVGFLGRYQLCKTFPNHESCRVGESKCSFAHYREEIHFWTLERDGHFDMNEFISRQREYISKGKMKRIVNGKPFEGGAKPSMPDVTQPPPYTHNKTMNKTADMPMSPQIPGLNYGNRPPVRGMAPQPAYQPRPPGPRPVAPRHMAPQAAPYRQPQQQQVPDPEVHKQLFPLRESHRFVLACEKCLAPTNQYGIYSHQPGVHPCTQDLFMLQTLHDQHNWWVRVRERRNHRAFIGHYAICRYATEPHANEETCSFAHNRIEQFLWGQEKDGNFNIQEFILENRSVKIEGKQFGVEDLYRRNPGDFVMLCRACYCNRPTILNTQSKKNPTVCSNPLGNHIWSENKYLVFLMQNQESQTIIRTIEERPFKHPGAFFQFCKYENYCMKRMHGTCLFAHSPIERDVWLLERDTGKTREQIVFEFNKFKSAQAAAEQAAASPSPSTSGRSTPATAVTPSSSSTSLKTSASAPAAQPQPDRERPPYVMTEVCQVCWRTGQKSVQDKKKDDRCTGRSTSHPWSIHKMFVVIGKNKTPKDIRKIPSGNTNPRGFILCVQIQQKKKCKYDDRCTFAHSMEEMEIWNFMIKYQMKSYDEYVAYCREYQESDQKGKAIEKGQSVVSARPLPAGAIQTSKPPSSVSGGGLSALMMASVMFHCQYCSVTCNSAKQWDSHCASQNHMFNVNSDKEHQWNFRQPPWGVSSGKYLLCQAHESGRCRYSHVPEIHNLCQMAHSQAELDEWRERWQWRQMKRDIARKEKVFSYMEELLEEYDESDAPVTVLSEYSDSEVVICGQEDSVFMSNKNATFCWNFEIQSGRELQKVALLLNKDRLHFSIKVQGDAKGVQISSGDSFQQDVNGHCKQYLVQVDFRGGLFGSFSQWVVFDFGSRPVMLRKLNVEIGTQFVQDKVKTLRQQLKFDRWTEENRQIVKFDQNGDTEFSAQLLRQYRPPSSADAVVNYESVGVTLNRHNYVHKMHKLLQLEELTRSHVISSYNLKTEIEVRATISEPGVYISARSGELFAKVPLNEQLSEDTDAGKLILSSVQRVLLAPQHTESYNVFEAVILQKENFDYDGKGKDYIYLCLSQECVGALKLDAGDSLPIEIQFQMDRRPFCQMHYAVDQLTNNDLVFPDVSRVDPNANKTETLRVSSDVLNEDQLEIVKHVVAESTRDHAPPFIIYGPFGTGKTETIAQATMLLLAQQPRARILICTHSNSAADLYITKHLDAFISKNRHHNYKLLRIYFQERRKATVNPLVLKYCILSPDKMRFRAPTEQDLQQCRVVISTLSTSLGLSRLRNSSGFFTHIFVDEAAQAMECEAIMPLALAGPGTCVVLAGDHMQMGPTAYSAEAKKQHFDKSLLERLYKHYESYQSLLGTMKPLKLLLKLNYRSKMEILRFISAISYGGPHELVAMSDQPDVLQCVPLTFYVAQGKEVQESDSTSFYNLAEVQEVTDRVEELYDAWPAHAWGERRGDRIAVVTPYYDQVNRIRLALRKRRPELRSVVVERIMNMQGKEFRAVFISTVRTVNLAAHPVTPSSDVSECDGSVGNFGFLTDQRLLNTALTRAQSFVSVVGDPVALCALGNCENVWRAYLKHCSQLSSICPPEVTYNSIRQNVIEFINSPMSANIASINAMNRDPNQMEQGMAISNGSSQAQPSSNGAVPNAWGVTPAQPVPFEYASVLRNKDKSAPAQNRAATSDVTSSASSEALHKSGADERLDVEEIKALALSEHDLLRQLAFDAVSKQQLTAGRTSSNKITSVEQINLRWLEIKDEEGHAIISYDDGAATKYDPNDSDDLDTSFGGEIEQMLGKTNGASVEQTPSSLASLLKSNPFKYKLCVLHVNSHHDMYAKVLDASSQVNTVLIATRERCGRALDGDEVVVEILHEKRLERAGAAAQRGSSEYTPQARVLGVLKHRCNITHKWCVCTVNPHNTGELIPMNPGLPHIYNLETRARAQRARKGMVSVYSVSRRTRDVQFHHHEPLSALKNQLFVVRCLSWDNKFHSPVGVVLGIIPTGNNEQTAQRLLHIEYDVPSQSFPSELMRELDQEYPAGYKIPEQNFAKRLDFRTNDVFTIAQAGSSAQNLALSFDMVKQGQYLLGVHVADISHFIRRGKRVDTEAADRGVACMGAFDELTPIYPQRVLTDILQLSAGLDRLTLSLFFQIDSQANILRVTPKKCAINSKKHLSLAEVQSCIKNPGGDGEMSGIQMSILGIYKTASTWRSKRLGCDAQLPDPSTNPDEFEAHVLINEIQIATNQYVAENLVAIYKQATPLIRQRVPGQHLMKQWCAQFGETAWNTLGLSRHFKQPGETCTCLEVCNCIELPQSASSLTPVLVEANAWSDVRNCLVNESSVGIQTVLAHTQSRPQVMLAWRQLEAILTSAQFVCLGDIEDPSESRHYSYNLNNLTSFTSPLTSYIDVVVHRLLIAVLKNQSCPYGPHEIASLCSKMNQAMWRASEYERRSKELKLALSLRKQPLSLYPLIDDVTQHGYVSLSFPPALRQFLCSMKVMLADLLYPGSAIEHNTEGKVTVLLPIKMVSADGDTPTDGWWPKYVQVPALNFQALLKAVKTSNVEAIQETALKANETVTDHVTHDASMTSAGLQVQLVPGHVSRVQLIADVQQGVLQPCVQLFSPAPCLDICLEHRTDPLKCYVDMMPSTESVSRDQYRDIAQYQADWLQALNTEACETALRTEAPTVVSGVAVTWYREGDETAGFVDLPVDFVVQNHFSFALDESAMHLMQTGSYFNVESEEERAYVCLRHPNIPVTPSPVAELSRRGTYTWVAHCLLTKVTVMSGFVRLQMHLIQSSVPPPEALIGQSVPATLEAIEKPAHIRVYQKALFALQNANQLCKDIALGNEPKPLDRAYANLAKPKIPANQVHLDQNQESIVQEALSQPFTVVEGVAGSGKTLIAARLAFIYAQMNKQNQAAVRSVVLVCAPTEAALGVLEACIRAYTGVHVLRHADLVAARDPGPLHTCHVLLCTPAHSLEVKQCTHKYLNVAQIIVDNSQMCSEPECIVPLAYFSPLQVVLLGDRQQCGPHVTSEQARRCGYGVSMFQRHAHRVQYSLTMHYRMHQGLAEFPANNFYTPAMKAMRNEQLKPSMLKLWPHDRDKPFVFLDVPDAIAEYDENTALFDRDASRFNQEEIHEVCRMVTSLVRRQHVKPSEVAVLSCSHAHCVRLRAALHSKGEKQVHVSTVSHSAGCEWDYVIITCASSVLTQHIEARPSQQWLQRHLGSIAEQHHLVTALTRARKGLIVIGNRQLLQLNKTWKGLLEYFELQGKIVDGRTFAK